MKKPALILSVVLFLVSPVFGGEDGESTFKSLGCMSCHRPEQSSTINPSIKEIAEAYQANPDQLVDYLNGQAEAVVRPEKARLMKRHVKKTKALSDAQRTALADYIMGHK